MKKVGILTVHTAHNYGTVLQAYALKQIIRNLGFECKCLNYQSTAQKSQYSLLDTYSLSLNAWIKFFLNCFYLQKLGKRAELFHQFIQENLNGADPLLSTMKEVEAEATGYDAIVVGSDQVWNVNLKDIRYDYLLDFPKKGRRISYAASFGASFRGISEHADRMIPLIRDFDFISTRETDATDYLSGFGIKSVTVADPTLLLAEAEWNRLAVPPRQREPYVLYYSLGCRRYSQNVAKQISSRLGLKVISPVLHPRAVGSGFRKEIACGPLQFLGLVRNAEFVCTDSFHGTVFSILFQKPFVSVFEGENGKLVRDCRRMSLLEKLELEENAVTQENEIDPSKYRNMDFSQAFRNLESWKNTSIGFLESSLEDM